MVREDPDAEEAVEGEAVEGEGVDGSMVWRVKERR